MPNRSLNDKVKRDSLIGLGQSSRRAVDLPINIKRFTINGKSEVAPDKRSNLGTYSKDRRVTPRLQPVYMPEAYGPSVLIPAGEAYYGLQKDVGRCGKRLATRATKTYGNGNRLAMGLDMAGEYEAWLHTRPEIWPIVKV